MSRWLNSRTVSQGHPAPFILRHCISEHSGFPVFRQEMSTCQVGMSFGATNGFDGMAKLGHFWFRMLAVLVACAAPFQTIPLTADQVRVRHMEGLMHGFLALRTLEGKRLADGEISQIAEANRVTSRLIFHFKDGSVYDDTTIFSERGTFRLLSDHLVERGPSFKQPMETSIDASSGQITVRYKDPA